MKTDEVMMYGDGSAESEVLLSEDAISKIREFASNPNHFDGCEDAEKLRNLLENVLRKVVSGCCCDREKGKHYIDDTDKVDVGIVSIGSALSVRLRLKDGRGAIGHFERGSSESEIETHFLALLRRCATSKGGLSLID